VLLAGDVLLVAVKVPVLPVEQVVPKEVRHRIAALGSIPRAPSTNAVRVPPVRALQFEYLRASTLPTLGESAVATATPPELAGVKVNVTAAAITPTMETN
jgi:hypothetical protein